MHAQTFSSLHLKSRRKQETYFFLPEQTDITKLCCVPLSWLDTTAIAITRKMWCSDQLGLSIFLRLPQSMAGMGSRGKLHNTNHRCAQNAIHVLKAYILRLRGSGLYPGTRIQTLASITKSFLCLPSAWIASKLMGYHYGMENGGKLPGRGELMKVR